MRNLPVPIQVLLIVIESIKHIMRHRQVMAPGFPFHSNNTWQPTKGLTKFFGFSCASLATWDFRTTNKFRVGGSPLKLGKADSPRHRVRKVVGAGKLPHSAWDSEKINEKKARVQRLCTERSNQGTDLRCPLSTLRGKK